MKHRKTDTQTQGYKNRYTEFHMAPSNKLFLKSSNYAAIFQPPAGVETQKNKNTETQTQPSGKVSHTELRKHSLVVKKKGEK